MSRPLIASFVLLAAVVPAVAQVTAPAESIPLPSVAASALDSTAIYAKGAASLVVVRYTWTPELGPKTIETAGVVVDASGLVMCSSASVGNAVPAGQIRDCKIVMPQPGGDPIELTAEFQGRDGRSDLVFFKAKAAHAWTPLTFAAEMPAPGTRGYAVGLLGKAVGYKPAIGQGLIATTFAIGPQLTVDSRPPGAGAVLFDGAGRAIGYAISPRPDGERTTPRDLNGQYLASAGFAADLADPPTPAASPAVVWLGVADWNALSADEAAYYGFTGGRPAVHVGAVVAGGPADKAGLRPGQVIAAIDGKPVPRGDGADSVPALIEQQLKAKKPGDAVTFDVIEKKNDQPRPIAVTLGAMPPGPETAARYWFEPLGFGVRDAVFADRYAWRLLDDERGVVVTLCRPGSPAAAGEVKSDTFVKQLNGQPVGDTKSFADELAKQLKDHPAEPIVLLVNQNGRDMTLSVETR